MIIYPIAYLKLTNVVQYLFSYNTMTNNDIITKFEDLSNELLFDIFEYLYGEELFNAFYGLNYRINSILKDSYLLKHIVFSRISEIQSIFNPEEIQFVNVTPLSSKCPMVADLQNASFMPCVSQLSLNRVFLPDLIVGLCYIKSQMPNLVNVTIDICNSFIPINNNIAFIIEGLLDLRYIRRLSLKLRFLYHTIVVYTLLSKDKPAPFLEHLSIIGCNITLLLIMQLLKNSPNLCSIEMKIQNSKCPDFSIFQQLTKATLKLIGFNHDNL